MKEPIRRLSLGVEEVPAASLIPHPRNANVGDPEAIAQSIRENGWYGRLKVSRATRHIVAGNHSYKGALLVGMETIPVEWLDLTDEEEVRIVLVDNKLTRDGHNDDALLLELLQELQATERGLAGTGHEEGDIDALLLQLEASAPTLPEVELGEGKDDPVEDAPRRVQKGDLWQLGEHLLLCGDSEDSADVARLMAGSQAQLVWTDPPWNVAYGSHNDNPHYRHRKIKNDDLGKDFPAFCDRFARSIEASTLPGAMIYVVMSAQEWPTIHKALTDHRMHWSSTIIWNKDRFVLSMKDYHTRYEPIWYGWREGAARLYPLEDRLQCDVWDFDRPKRSDEHPTMKPVDLVARAVKNSSAQGDIVLDLFAGSGTTLIACEQTHRHCRAMEMDEIYADGILTRWERLTGKVAQRLEGPAPPPAG